MLRRALTRPASSKHFTCVEDPFTASPSAHLFDLAKRACPLYLVGRCKEGAADIG